VSFLSLLDMANMHYLTRSLALEAHHRFTVDEGDWGFTKFAELRSLMCTTKERARPLVEDESANLTAYVRVVKDPTGVLWHNFLKYAP